MLTHIRNWNCDGDGCAQSQGEVRVYPLGGSIDVSLCVRSHGEVRAYSLGTTTELILCRACWERANDLRQQSGLPSVNWHEGEVYTCTPGLNERCYEHAVQEVAWNSLRDRIQPVPRGVQTRTRKRSVVPAPVGRLTIKLPECPAAPQNRAVGASRPLPDRPAGKLTTQ